MAGAQSIGQGIQNFSDQYAKFKEETDLLKAKTKAFEDMIKTNPDLFGLNDPDKLKAFTDQAPNESLRQKNARLSQFMEATMTQKVMEKGQREAAQQEQQRRIGEQQLRAGQQAMAQNAFIMQNQQRKAAEEAALRARFEQTRGLSEQLGAGVGGGVLSADAQKYLGSPLVKAQIEAERVGVRLSGNELTDYAAKLEATEARKGQRQGGFGTAEEALKAAEKTGATSVSLQQTSDGRYLLNTTNRTLSDKPTIEKVGGREFSRDANGNWRELKDPNAPLRVAEWVKAHADIAMVNPKQADQAFGKNYGEYLRIHDAQMATVKGGPNTLSTLDQQALNWANANPNDPRSVQIKARLGVR